MRTSRSQLTWIFRWIIRILFFPIWIWALRRRYIREQIQLRCKCDWLPGGERFSSNCPEHGVKVLVEQKMSDVTYSKEYPHHREKIDTKEKVANFLAPQKGECGIRGCDNEVMYHDNGPVVICEMCAKLQKKPKPEKIKNPELRRLQLLTANSQAVKDGTYPPNTFVLNDNGDMESLGPEVRVKFLSWYPKAMAYGLGTDPSIEVSYNLGSELFERIKEQADTNPHSGCMYGAEYVFELRGELVTCFFGTKSSRRASSNVKRIVGYEHILSSKQMKTKVFEWCAIEVTPVKPQLWMGEPIIGLDDKHLWNIIQAIGTGKWANGKPVRFNPVLATALTVEYTKRSDDGHYSKKKIKKIKKLNKKYEDKFLKQTGKASRA